MSGPLRVAYTLEQCWHRVPGGTAVAALRVLDELAERPDLAMLGVAGTHAGPPDPPFRPSVAVAEVSGQGARLYASWLLARRPRVESATGPVDLVHATTIIPAPGRAPLVVTVHDLAFLHEPGHFTRWGRFVFERSLAIIRSRAAAVLCSSEATRRDCTAAGIPSERLHTVPLGVDPRGATSSDLARVRTAHRLPERFVLFVGTVEPRKNLARLAEAMRAHPEMPLVVAGPDGWGDAAPVGLDIRFLGFVPEADLAAVYASATVFAYPSLREGFGLPVLEAMQAGVPVVTSRGTATEEAAGGAAVLVEPTDTESIASGITEALDRRDELAALGAARAATMTWERTADATAAVYRQVAGR